MDPSCRASRGDLRGAFRGSAVDKFRGALCVGCGGEYRSVVSRQHSQPGCDIGCVILSRFKSKLQIGTQKRGPEFGNQFLDSVTFASEAMPTEVTVEPRLAARPVSAFMGKRRVIILRVFETLDCRHLDRIGGDAVKRPISGSSIPQLSIVSSPSPNCFAKRRLHRNHGLPGCFQAFRGTGAGRTRSSSMATDFKP